MITTGISERTLWDIVSDISSTHFDGNLRFDREPDQISKSRLAFTLRVGSSRGAGARRSYQGRRMVSACFHAYSMVIERILNSGARRITSARTTFTPADLTMWGGILEREGAKNIGSMMEPMAYGNACECGEQSDMRKCPHFIMVAGHYRTDGSCRCDSIEHRAMMIREWEYSAAAFTEAADKP